MTKLEILRKRAEDAESVMCGEIDHIEAIVRLRADVATLTQERDSAIRTVEQEQAIAVQMQQERDSFAAEVKALRGALKRVLPMVLACKHEVYSDLAGNEDTKTEALANAYATLAASTTAGEAG